MNFPDRRLVAPARYNIWVKTCACVCVRQHCLLTFQLAHVLAVACLLQEALSGGRPLVLPLLVLHLFPAAEKCKRPRWLEEQTPGSMFLRRFEIEGQSASCVESPQKSSVFPLPRSSALFGHINQWRRCFLFCLPLVYEASSCQEPSPRSQRTKPPPVCCSPGLRQRPQRAPAAAAEAHLLI